MRKGAIGSSLCEKGGMSSSLCVRESHKQKCLCEVGGMNSSLCARWGHEQDWGIMNGLFMYIPPLDRNGAIHI